MSLLKYLEVKEVNYYSITLGLNTSLINYFYLVLPLPYIVYLYLQWMYFIKQMVSYKRLLVYKHSYT